MMTTNQPKNFISKKGCSYLSLNLLTQKPAPAAAADHKGHL